MPGAQAGASAVSLERPARGKAQWSHPTLSITWTTASMTTVRRDTWDLGTSGYKDKMLLNEENV